MVESRNGSGNPRRVALVIGSGSVKCAAAIGLYRVFRREGIEFDMVVGCSGGSIYAASIALGHAPDAIAEMTRRFWTRDVTASRNSRALLQILMPQVFGFDERYGMVDDRKALARLREAFGDTRIEDASIPLYLTATDFNSGEQVVLTKGSLVDAIRGSIAIPYIFSPHPVDGRLLTDGFLSDPLPVGVPIVEGADIIVAMGFESSYQTRVDSFARFAFQVSSVMSNNLLKANFAFHNLAHHSEVIPIIPQFQKRIGSFDTTQIPHIIEEGARAAEEQVPYLRTLVASLSGS